MSKDSEDGAAVGATIPNGRPSFFEQEKQDAALEYAGYLSTREGVAACG